MNRVIILLGASNDIRGKLSSLAIERCEQALLEYRRQPSAKILPTGGYGAHFNTTDQPHATYLRQYLVARGVPEADVLEPALSSTTLEDARLSRPTVDKVGVTRVIVVTSDFHMRRARYIFERAFPGIELTFSACVTRLPPDELRARQQHEELTLAKLVAVDSRDNPPSGL
jgi:uncharacterized SAM-binding protein YcdF (DUF218 family)